MESLHLQLSNLSIEPDLLKEIDILESFPFPIDWTQRTEIKKIPIDLSSDEASMVSGIIGPDVKIAKLFRIENPFLYQQFILKKQHLLSMSGTDLRKRYLLHATKHENVESICKGNLNWRNAGKSVGHRFGIGVSFTPSFQYASHYTTIFIEDGMYYSGAYFLCQVLIRKSCCGHNLMVEPGPGFDTSQKPNGDVIVKYDDNTFYPEYLFYT